jgi:hypothetical protein
MIFCGRRNGIPVPPTLSARNLVNLWLSRLVKPAAGRGPCGENLIAPALDWRNNRVCPSL